MINDKYKVALNLCQKIGMSTMFTDCNDGMSLPLEISKKIAITVINEICPETEYWNDVKKEIESL